jgi:hypothetical protein
MFQRLWRWRRERRSGSFCARRLGLEEETKRCPLLPSPSCIWASWAFSLGLNMGHFRTRRTAPSCGEDNNLLRLPPLVCKRWRRLVTDLICFLSKGSPSSRSGASSRSWTASTGGKSPAAAAALLLLRMRLQVLVWDPVAASPVT